MSRTPEAAIILRRLAWKLGTRDVALLGLVRPEIITALPRVDVSGFDDLEHASYAVALHPSGRWDRLSEAVDQIPKLDRPVVGVSFDALETLGEGDLAAILDGAPGALICEAGGSGPRGIEALRRRRTELESLGLRIVAEDLIGASNGAPARRDTPAFLVAGVEERRLSALTETGLHSLRMDPAVDTWADPERPARVLIVSYEVVGPKRNGGIGTANTSLAVALAAHGNDVTLMFTGVPDATSDVERWTTHFAELDVCYLEVEPGPWRAETAEYFNVRQAWATYVRVRALHEEKPVDIIHAPECQGHLAYVALAKRHGIAFAGAELVTGVHSSTRWCAEANLRAVAGLEELTTEFLEQTSVAMSDVVISPSAYLLDYLRARGWRLPERSFVQQYVTSQETQALTMLEHIDDAGDEATDRDLASVPTEVVFFGRLEARKGVVAFCDAVDRLSDLPPSSFAVTFMGSSTATIDGGDAAAYIERRAREWPWPVRLETEMSHAEAITHLRSSPCLAVMPSLVDNSPNTVYEALALEIPMLVSRSGGTWELIALDELDRVSFSGWPVDGPLEPASSAQARPGFDADPLADLLREALATAPRPARPRFDPIANELAHVGWTHGLAARVPPAAEYPEPPSIELLPPGDAAGLRSAARVATRDVLVVLPETVTVKPRLAEVLGRAASRSPADVFLFVAAVGDDVRIPPGGPAIAGLSQPVFGTHGFAIRADALRRIGGFQGSGPDGTPGSDVLVRAGLAGLRVEVIPEVLVYRPAPVDGQEGTVGIAPGAWSLAVGPMLDNPHLFGHGGTLADLPAVYLDQVPRFARAYEELRAHADRVQADQQASHYAYVVEHAEVLRLSDALTSTRAEFEAALVRAARAESTLQSVLDTRAWKLAQTLRRAVRSVGGIRR